jgi:hypothetical protein
METDESDPSPADRNLLRRYFYSGWAFFMPYLFFYLLYYWRKWPVNPLPGYTLGNGGHIPALLHVYWFLHIIHVVLGFLALRTWFVLRSLGEGGWPSVSGLRPSTSLSSVALAKEEALNPQPSVVQSFSFSAFLPWALLALIFYIPGAYLEWPSDPWEHLRRINEWHICQTVGTHSTWVKSSYFLTYSLLGWAFGLQQLFWLDFYYTGICLLLCWQYYRLARMVGLSERASLVFVILQVILFGNNVFSFYRYYGISSSIYAQLGAVALTRLGIEVMSRKSKNLKIEKPENSSRQTKFRFPLSASPLFQFSNFPIFLQSLGAGGCLVLLTAFNHGQGIGIAVLGLAAVATWRLIAWKRSAGWILLAAVILLSLATVHWYPRHPALDRMYRPQGYLNAWYGFNIFSLSSPAGDRMLQIIGAFGLVNLAAGLLLLCRNHPVGWLTVMPVIALSLPCVAIPFAGLLAQHDNEILIVTFQRMLFAIPPNLALVSLGACLMDRSMAGWFTALRRPADIAVIFTSFVLIGLTVIPSSSPSYNRLWNASVKVPDDLRLRDIFVQYESVKSHSPNTPETKIVTVQAGTALLACTSAAIATYQLRTIGLPSTKSITATLNFLHFNELNNGRPPTRKIETIQKPNVIGNLNLIPDPNANNPSAWLTLGGPKAEFVAEITDLPAVKTALQNPAGALSETFTSALVPVCWMKTYRLEINVKQLRNTRATAYLAVAWYDENGNLLESSAARPKGADNPEGWSNGTFSYFGLISQVPPTSWTKYGISFGWGEDAIIPPQARFVRVGALLNYNTVPLATIQLTNVRLFKEPTPEIDMAIPPATSVYSPVSQAGLLSTHWPPQQVMVDRGGTKEIRTAIETIRSFQESSDR